jgi:F-type H+-transporting ATPase subunit b
MKRLVALLVLATPTLALAAEAAHEAEKAPTPFAGTIAQSIAALLVFGIVFVVLKAKAWGPILKGLNDREDKIRGDLVAAEKARAEAIAKLEEYKKQISGADAEVREKLAAATKDAEAIATRLKMQAQQEAEEAKARATKEIDEARKAAIADVQNQAASIGTLIASKILKRSINEQDQADLVRASLEEMGRK